MGTQGMLGQRDAGSHKEPTSGHQLDFQLLIATL